jgi:hypothetical protein
VGGQATVDRHGAKNLPQQLALDTSASTVSTGASPAAGGKLAGFYCLVCGHVVPDGHVGPAATFCWQSERSVGN